MKIRLSNNNGFTLIELLTVCTILSVVVASMFMFYFSGMKLWAVGNQKVELQQHGRIAMNRMTRELRQAKEIIASDSNTGEISFVNLNGDQIKFYVSGTQLLRSGGNNPLANHVQSVVFIYSPSERTLKIELNLAEGEQRFALRTIVAPRNLLDS
jgi:prepilin-type N-terminal cleavage/methylation domain-containing protein